MKIIRTAALILSILTLSLTCLACTSNGNYRDDLSSADVMQKIEAALPAGDGYVAVSDGYISASMWGEEYTALLDAVSDWKICISEKSDSNVDEFGLFHVKNPDKVSEVKSIVESYLAAQQLRLPAILDMYNPDEIPKVENGKVLVCGNYVLYTMLNADATSKAQSACKDALKKAE